MGWRSTGMNRSFITTAMAYPRQEHLLVIRSKRYCDRLNRWLSGTDVYEPLFLYDSQGLEVYKVVRSAIRSHLGDLLQANPTSYSKSSYKLRHEDSAWMTRRDPTRNSRSSALLRASTAASAGRRGASVEERLRWDYESSRSSCLQYLDSRILPGFVALDRGRVCGFTFCVYEGHKAVLAMPMPSPRSGAGAADCTRATAGPSAGACLSTRPTSIGLSRRCCFMTRVSLTDSFREAGFTLYPRLFMEYDCSSRA